MASDELRRARRAAQTPPGASLLLAFLRLPAHQARALLQTAPEDAAPLEGGIVGVILSAALRHARGLDSGGGRLAPPPQRADGDDDAHGVLLRFALARFPVAGQAEDRPTPPRIYLAQALLFNALLHRSRRLGSPPSAVFLLSLFLRLPARHARRLLPLPAEPTHTAPSAHPGPSLVSLLLCTGLRRLWGRSLHRDDDDDDDYVLLVLLRVALARVCPARRAEVTPPGISFAQRLVFTALLHRLQGVGSPPSGVYLLRLLLRIPAHQAQRLLPPPTERTHPGPCLAHFLLYGGLRRLQANIQPGSDGLLRELVQVLAVHLQVPRLSPSVVDRGGLLSAALALIRRALRGRPLHRDEEDDDDVLLLILRLALTRIGRGL